MWADTRSAGDAQLLRGGARRRRAPRANGLSSALVVLARQAPLARARAPGRSPARRSLGLVRRIPRAVAVRGGDDEPIDGLGYRAPGSGRRPLGLSRRWPQPRSKSAILFPLASRTEPRRGLRAPWAGRWPALRTASWFSAVGDGAASNIGSDCVDPTRMALNVGTSAALRVVTRDRLVPPRGLWRYRVDRARASSAARPRRGVTSSRGAVRCCASVATKKSRPRWQRCCRMDTDSPCCPTWPASGRQDGVVGDAAWSAAFGWTRARSRSCARHWRLLPSGSQWSTSCWPASRRPHTRSSLPAARSAVPGPGPRSSPTRSDTLSRGRRRPRRQAAGPPCSPWRHLGFCRISPPPGRRSARPSCPTTPTTPAFATRSNGSAAWTRGYDLNMGSDANLTVCADPAALAETAANLIVDAAIRGREGARPIPLCLAGGETPRATYTHLALPSFSDRIRWDRTWVFFGDERAVPPEHPESNYRMAYETLLSRVPIPAAQIFRMRAEQADADGAAAAYAAELAEAVGTRRGELPRFDIVLLGLGVDGHTASLFPGSPVLREVFRHRRRGACRGRADPAAADAHVPGPERGGARRLPGHGSREGEDRQDRALRERHGPRRARATDRRRAHLAHRSLGGGAPSPRRAPLAMPTIPDEPFTLIIFGASGDLTRRKLVPALWSLYAGRTLPEPFAIIGSGRTEVGNDEFRRRMREAVREFARTQPPSANVWDRFAASLSYVAGDPANPALYGELEQALKAIEGVSPRARESASSIWRRPRACTTSSSKTSGPRGSRIPAAAGHVSSSRSRSGTTTRARARSTRIWAASFARTRSIGSTTTSGRRPSRTCSCSGSPTRSSSRCGTAITSAEIQITVAESIGVETRGAYYEEAGALRDMMQNHLLQLLCLIAMEPPVTFDAGPVHDEKNKVMHAIRPIDPRKIDEVALRGQYASGLRRGQAGSGLSAGEGCRARIPGPRPMRRCGSPSTTGAGRECPFYLRTGKRMAKRVSEIAIRFHRTPHMIFHRDPAGVEPNELVIRIQPDEGMALDGRGEDARVRSSGSGPWASTFATARCSAPSRPRRTSGSCSTRCTATPRSTPAPTGWSRRGRCSARCWTRGPRCGRPRRTSTKPAPGDRRRQTRSSRATEGLAKALAAAGRGRAPAYPWPERQEASAYFVVACWSERLAVSSTNVYHQPSIRRTSSELPAFS